MRAGLFGLLSALLCAPHIAFALEPPAQSCRTGAPIPEDAWTRGKSGERSHESERDVDGDDVADHVRVVRDGGAGEGSVAVTVRSSRFETELRVETTVSFYGFLAITPVPDALLDDAHQPLREAFEDMLFQRMCDRPDPSMEWLLDERHRLRWYGGPPQMPAFYTILERDEAVVSKLRNTMREAGEPFDERAVWLTYLGHNHLRTRDGSTPAEIPYVLAERGRRVLLGTAHGVILTTPRRDRHAWIYVHAGGQKLRFPTIFAASFLRGAVRVQWRLGQVETIGESMVSLRTGRVTGERQCSVYDDEDRPRTRCP